MLGKVFCKHIPRLSKPSPHEAYVGRREGRRVSLAASTAHEAREQTPNCVQDRMSTVAARGVPKMRNKQARLCASLEKLECRVKGLEINQEQRQRLVHQESENGGPLCNARDHPSVPLQPSNHGRETGWKPSAWKALLFY